MSDIDILQSNVRKTINLTSNESLGLIRVAFINLDFVFYWIGKQRPDGGHQ